MLGHFQQPIRQTAQARTAAWQPDFRSLEAYEQSLTAQRARCREMLGLIDQPEWSKKSAEGEAP